MKKRQKYDFLPSITIHNKTKYIKWMPPGVLWHFIIYKKNLRDFLNEFSK